MSLEKETILKELDILMLRDITNEDLVFLKENQMPELSKQQLNIIKLLCQGKNNNEIAETLNITYKTVKNHIAVLYRKLGVKNRTEAVLLWLQLERDLDKNLKVRAMEEIIAEKDKEINQLKKIIYELRKSSRY